MFVENLSQFFDPAGHAVAVALKDPAGATLRTVNVILEVPTRGVVVFDGEVMQGTPFAVARTADLVGLKRDYQLVDGATVYRVTESPEDDGTGVSTVRLREQ